MEKPFLAIQWHITSMCDQRCRHCYVFNSEENYDHKNDLQFSDMNKVMISFLECCSKLNANPRFVFTGGDPLMRSDFLSILDLLNKEADKRGFNRIAIDMMGNPFHLTSSIAKRLKEKGVRRYQISLDGLEEKHDFIRNKKDSFKHSMEAIRILSSSGIETHVMFTLSKLNQDDFSPLVKILAKNNVNAFAFARLIRPKTINNEDYNKESFTPLEYREFLAKTQRLYDEINKAGYKIKFPLKDHLWKLLFYEQGKIKIDLNSSNGLIYSGCGLGMGNISVLSDGTVYACRRFESPIGKVPNQEIIDIFLNSEKLNYYRDISKFIKCSKCELLQYCRGCGAVAHGCSGSFFDPDPQCWKIVNLG